jgi:NADH:ubiquinone oxidoreductase subunit 6 (subunit J)
MRGDPVHTDNVVSRARAAGLHRSRLARAFTGHVLLVIALATVAAILFVPDRRIRGVLLVLLLAGAIGWTVAWLAGTRGRLSESGREMGDFED